MEGNSNTTTYEDLDYWDRNRVFFGLKGGRMNPARSARRRRWRTLHNKHTRRALRADTQRLLDEALSDAAAEKAEAAQHARDLVEQKAAGWL